MRIIQFSDSFYPVMDGVGSVVFQYAQNIGTKGHECYVVAPQTDTGCRGRFPFEIVDYMGVRMPVIKSYRVGAPVLDTHCLNRLNMIQADVVHVHTPFIAGRAGLAYAQKKNCPVVGTFHSKYYEDFRRITGTDLLAKVGVKYVVKFYEKCSEVWTVSESSADTLRGYGYEGPLQIMPNGTNPCDIPEGTEAAVAAQYGLGDEPLLLYVGQINWKKNLECTLRACSLLKRPFRLALVGQGQHRKAVGQLAAELGLEDRLLFTGHITDRATLGALYRLASLFLFPSLYDTSGLVVREAAAAGTPSVVVRGSSAAEGIRDGENGFLCEDDPADLARVIENALDSPELLADVGARAKASIPIPWSGVIDDVLERYSRLIEQIPQ